MPQDKKLPKPPPVPQEGTKARPTSQHQQMTAASGKVFEKGEHISSGERIKSVTRPALKEEGESSGGGSAGAAKDEGK